MGFVLVTMGHPLFVMFTQPLGFQMVLESRFKTEFLAISDISVMDKSKLALATEYSSSNASSDM